MTESDSGGASARLPADLVAMIGQAGYYQGRHADFLARCPDLVPPGYYLDYGQKYFDRFQKLREKLSQEGQGWIKRTTLLLQKRIEDRRAADPGSFSLLECDGEGFRRFAYATHPDAYIEGGLARLPPEDVLLVMHTPDAKDLLNHDGIEQIVRTALDVVITNGPLTNVEFVLKAADELGEHLLGKSGRTWRAAFDAAERDLEVARSEAQRVSSIAHRAEANVVSLFSRFAGHGIPSLGIDWLVMRQDWRNPVFCSWRLPPSVLRPLVPPSLELDLYDGSAWVSMVPLQMTNVGIVKPTLPPLPTFAEINLRTYVRYRGQVGVYFFSLDCGEVMVDIGAKMFFRLPYKLAKVSIDREGDWFRCESRSLIPGREAILRCRYRSLGEPAATAPGSLDSFLVERYSLFVVDSSTGTVHRGDVRHTPWTVQGAEIEIYENTVLFAAGVPVPPKPDHVGFSPGVSTEAIPFVDVT